MILVNTKSNATIFWFTFICFAFHTASIVLFRTFLRFRGEQLFLPATIALGLVNIALLIINSNDAFLILFALQVGILYVCGRSLKNVLFDGYSIVATCVSVGVLLMHWTDNVVYYSALPSPFWHKGFFLSLAFIGIYIATHFAAKIFNKPSMLPEPLDQIVPIALPSVALVALYNSVRIEIADVFVYRGINSGLGESAFSRESAIWQINYTVIFAGVKALLTRVFSKNVVLKHAAFITLAGALLIFFVSLLIFDDMRELLLNGDPRMLSMLIGVLPLRYLSLAIFTLGFAVYSLYLTADKEILPTLGEPDKLRLFEMTAAVTGLIFLSAETINLMKLFGFADAYKFGLSTLWGIYSLALVAIGIAWKKRDLRIFAIALFAVTILKLFMVDSIDLDTVTKTILYMLLGGLLLVISFLYNRYKDLIFGKD